MKLHIKLIIVVAMLFFQSISKAEGWIEDFEQYSLNQSLWDSAYYSWVPWSNISNPIKYSRIQRWDQATPYYWGVGDNHTSILFSLNWNNSWYSSAIGSFESSDTIELAAQVANYTHFGTTGNPVFPRACHIIIGGIALGISGDDISYKLVPGTPPVWPLGDNDFNSVTRVAPVMFKTWYDVKIVVHQVNGPNNDQADLYYKLSSDSEWTQIMTGINTNQDVDSNVYIALYAGDNLAAMDNIELKIVPPLPAHCGDRGTVYMEADLNKDCYVDFDDIQEISVNWLQCNDPITANCN